MSALPSKNLSQLLVEQKELKELLNSIDFVDVAIANVGYNKELQVPRGFGYLIPTKANSKALGVIFDSDSFPDQLLFVSFPFPSSLFNPFSMNIKLVVRSSPSSQ